MASFKWGAARPVLSDARSAWVPHRVGLLAVMLFFFVGFWSQLCHKHFVIFEQISSFPFLGLSFPHLYHDKTIAKPSSFAWMVFISREAP